MRIQCYRIIIMISWSLMIGCQNVTGSEDDSDSLDAPYVWRICNESKDSLMEDIMIPGHDSLGVWSLPPDNCSVYYPTNWALGDLRYSQKEEEYHFIYLANYSAVRGLVDSTQIKETPGRYTYHFTRDTTLHWTRWFEIEREAYH